MKPSVYLDTSVVSFLCGRLNDNDLHTRLLQNFTRAWWPTASEQYDLRVSEFVLDEARKGDIALAQERLQALKNVRLQEFENETVSDLAQKLLDAKVLPAKATYDALHIACCACAGIDILATWNFRHLANGQNMLKMQSVCSHAGYTPPLILTLYQLGEYA